jgi:hypothetical protein
MVHCLTPSAGVGMLSHLQGFGARLVPLFLSCVLGLLFDWWLSAIAADVTLTANTVCMSGC